MKVFLVFLLVIAIFCALPREIYAHPGNTAADGCHYCRTNCDKWGVSWNARHCHGGVSTPVQIPESPAPIIVPIPTSEPFLKPTATPKPSVRPTVKPAPSLKPSPIGSPSSGLTPEPLVEAAPLASVNVVGGVKAEARDEAKGFWEWLFSLFK